MFGSGQNLITFVGLIAAICPNSSTLTSAANPAPLPVLESVIVGALVYPDPANVRLIAVITPLSTTAVPVATTPLLNCGAENVTSVPLS